MEASLPLAGCAGGCRQKRRVLPCAASTGEIQSSSAGRAARRCRGFGRPRRLPYAAARDGDADARVASFTTSALAGRRERRGDWYAWQLCPAHLYVHCDLEGACGSHAVNPGVRE
eukprot:363205-Chlamydomonas_euryale.AAC.14